jgi:hemerythrin-like domain-containing protein
MRTPTDVLRDEHRVILRALDVVERAIARAAGGAAVPDGWWADAVAWLRGFADANHHAKEEQSLFPALLKAGVPSEGGPVAVMLEEHAQGRALLAAIAAAGAASTAAARDYVALLRAHIDKENGVLFPLADALIDGTLMETVRREFEAVAAAPGAAASTDAAEAAVERLAAALEGR